MQIINPQTYLIVLKQVYLRFGESAKCGYLYGVQLIIVKYLICGFMGTNQKRKLTWPDFLAIVCGVICILQGWFFLMMFIHNHDGRLWLWLLPDWQTIPQFLLCLSGVVLTVRRFIRKKKGLAFKEYEWIPLIISYAFGIPFILPAL